MTAIKKKPINKTFEVLIQFDNACITVRAKNGREAKRKAFERLKTNRAYRYADKRNCFVEQVTR